MPKLSRDQEFLLAIFCWGCILIVSAPFVLVCGCIKAICEPCLDILCGDDKVRSKNGQPRVSEKVPSNVRIIELENNCTDETIGLEKETGTYHAHAGGACRIKEPMMPSVAVDSTNIMDPSGGGPCTEGQAACGNEDVRIVIVEEPDNTQARGPTVDDGARRRAEQEAMREALWKEAERKAEELEAINERLIMMNEVERAEEQKASERET